MTAEVKAPEVEKEEPKPEIKEEPKTETPEIDRAEAANAEKARLLKEEEALQARKEALHAKELVGGRAAAGHEDKPKTEEEIVTDEADKLMAGYFDEGEKLSDPLPTKKDDPKPFTQTDK